jgi:hypothetical protein
LIGDMSMVSIMDSQVNMDWNKEFLPWLESLPEEDRLEVTDLLLQIMAAVMNRRFHGRVSPLACAVLAGIKQPDLN